MVWVAWRKFGGIKTKAMTEKTIRTIRESKVKAQTEIRKILQGFEQEHPEVSLRGVELITAASYIPGRNEVIVSVSLDVRV